jgi:hypothetical protein
MMKSRNLARFSKGEALEDCNHNSIAILLDDTDRVVKDFPRLDYIGFTFRYLMAVVTDNRGRLGCTRHYSNSSFGAITASIETLMRP